MPATSGRSSTATTTARSRRRPASSTRTSTRRSTTRTSWSTPTASCPTTGTHSVQGQRQLHFQQGASTASLRRSVDPLGLGLPAHRVRLLVRVQQLGVLPDAARLAGPWPVGLRGGRPLRLSVQDRRPRAPGPAGRLQRARPSGDPPVRPALQPHLGWRRAPASPTASATATAGLQHNGATFTPIGQLSNPRATATNPDFLSKGTSFTCRATSASACASSSDAVTGSADPLGSGPRFGEALCSL